MARDCLDMILSVLFVIFFMLNCVVGNQPKKKIVIAGLFPLSENVAEGAIGRGVTPAVKLALQMINRNKNILSGYELEIVPSDTMCDMAVATKFFFDMVDSNNTLVMVFGDACSTVSGPIAEISKWWNVSLLSYADTDPILSDRKKYNNFYRTVPSESDFNPARLALLRKFNWTNVGTIFQGVSEGTARYGHAHNHLISLLEKSNINVIKSVGIVNDPETEIVELKKSDVRIIIGNFDVKIARYVFCHAFKNRMFGPKYQWIILGGYPDDWWTIQDEKLSCSPAELNRTIYGYMTTDILPLSSSNEKTVSGWRPMKYEKKYKEKNGGHYSKFHAYAFDGVWVMAKVIDSILKNAHGIVNMTTLDEEMFRGEEISSALNSTNFKGVTGQIRFQGGDRIGSILFEQFQGNKMVKIGEYHKINDDLTFEGSEQILWLGKGPPIDKKHIYDEYRRVPQSIYFVICSLAGMGIIMSCFFLVTNILFREHRYIKMSSPNMNNIITVGCILTYVSVFLLGTDGGVVHRFYRSHICISRAWVLSLGFTLAFGAMFSKTWRVHSIFKDVTLHKKVIKDCKLFLLVTVLVVIDAGILITWQVLDPLQTSTKELTALVKGDISIIPKVEYCKSNRMTTWLGLIYAYKGLLLVFGCFLAWETRYVNLPALNDSKYIGMSVYNVVIMCVCGAAVSFVINDQPTSSFVIISFFIIFCTTITLCLVFVPKLIELRRDPTGEERRIRAKLQKPKKQNSREEINDDLHRKNDELQNENIRCRSIIAEKMRVLHSLMAQLGEDIIRDEIHYVAKSPIHKKVIQLRMTDSSPSKLSSISTASDADDASVYSEISFGPPSWAMGTIPFNRNHQHGAKSVTSTCTDTSVVESFEEPVKRPSFVQPPQSATETIETDDDDCDAFGGVYCGPPKRPSLKFNKSCNENGRAKIITEVHPLVHDFPNKSYMTSGTDIYKPYNENDIINNIRIKSVSKPKNTAELRGLPLLEVKKNALLGKRRRLRKITFMFPDQERRINNCTVKSLQRRARDNDVDRGREKVDGAKSEQLSCDIIEHI